MIDIHKYSGKDKSEIKAEILHTSGHARIGRGDQIGSVSNQSFQQRIELSQQPRTIADYQRSAIGGRFSVLKAKKAEPRMSRLKRSTAPSDGDGNGASSRQAFNAGDMPPEKPSTGFKEPPSRGYNPYA